MAEGNGILYKGFMDMIVTTYEATEALNACTLTSDMPIASPHFSLRCPYCNSVWLPNRFHPEHCDQCGGPR